MSVEVVNSVTGIETVNFVQQSDDVIFVRRFSQPTRMSAPIENNPLNRNSEFFLRFYFVY